MIHRSSTSTSTNIKNLAIALEAFSRFPVDHTLNNFVISLIEKEIEIMQEEQNPIVEFKPTPLPQAQTSDDDIPF